MNNKNNSGEVTVKQEATSPTAKKVLLSNSSFASLANKNASNARLPSFKPPRDLFLTGSVTGTTHSTFSFNSGSKSTRKTFTPNINVTRKKGACETTSSAPKTEANSSKREREKNKVSFSRKKNSNVVQTKGVFSEGLAPGKIKQFGNSFSEKGYSDSHILDKPKLNLNKKIHKKEEDTKLNSLLRDNFIDDPSQVPDTTFIPKCLPMICNVSAGNSEDLEKTFEMLQVKPEKMANLSGSNTKNVKPILDYQCENSQSTPKMFLFEFPSVCQNISENNVENKKKSSKKSSSEADDEQEKTEGLSSLGEGFFGHLRIHENGKAFLVTGNSVLPLHVNKLNNKQEVMSVSVNCDTMKGEVISLGNIDANIICSANIFQGVR